MAEMTPERIAEIRQREQQATKGPWVVRPEEFDSWGWIRAAGDGHLVANCGIGGRGEWKDGQPKYGTKEWHDGPQEVAANAQFLAHARQDIPDLLDALSSAQQEIADLRERLEEVLGHWHHQRVIDDTDDDQKTGRRPCPMATTPTVADVRRWRSASE